MDGRVAQSICLLILVSLSGSSLYADNSSSAIQTSDVSETDSLFRSSALELTNVRSIFQDQDSTFAPKCDELAQWMQDSPVNTPVTLVSSISEVSSVVNDVSVNTVSSGFDDRISPVVVDGRTRATLAICQQDGSCWRPLDTLTLFGGLEGSKQPQDFGVNANFGSRWAANWGIPLLAEYGIGAQIGTSINYTNNAVQVFDRVGATTTRTQNYTTIGVFQRTEHWRWGVAYDILYESYYDQFLMGQWRGRAGYAPSNRNEYGVWFTVPEQFSNGSFLNVPVQLSPMAQGSAYWQHVFSSGARGMFWGGVSQGHGQANYALGDLPPTNACFVFGAEIDVPLNQYFALYGQANFISPADTGTVDSFLGITFYPGGGAYPVSRNAFTPYQALANNTMFATNLRRR